MGVVMEPGYPNLLVHFHFTRYAVFKNEKNKTIQGNLIHVLQSNTDNLVRFKSQRISPNPISLSAFINSVAFFQTFSFALCVFEAFITILKSSPMMTIFPMLMWKIRKNRKQCWTHSILCTWCLREKPALTDMIACLPATHAGHSVNLHLKIKSPRLIP